MSCISPTSIETMGPLLRRDFVKFRSLIDTYVDATSPGRRYALAGEVYKLLCVMSKRLFVICVDDLLTRAFNANPDIVPTYIKLFEQIKNASIRLPENGQIFPISQAISGQCMKHPASETLDDVANFRRKLPLINELYRLNLIQRGYYKFFAKMFANLRRGEVGIAFLHEILANVNWLIENSAGVGDQINNAYSMDDDFWTECATVLSEACRKGIATNTNLVNNIYRLLESIKKRCKFAAPVHSSTRGELVSPIDDPAIVKISTNKAASPKVNHDTTPLPSNTEQEQAVVSNVELSTAHQQQLSVLSDVRLAMQTLARYPEQFPICAAHIQRLLEGYCATSKDGFVGAIDELLNETLNATPRAFQSYMLLLEHLIKTLPPVPLRKAVVQSAMQIHRLETVEHVTEFCSSFRLSNELCRLGLLQSHVFKHYVNELAKPERDLSYLFTLEVMKNVDFLIDIGIAKLNGLEVSFWESCAERLTKAGSNRRLVTAEKEVEIQQFLNMVKQKGGWNRRLRGANSNPDSEVPHSPKEPTQLNKSVSPPTANAKQLKSIVEDAEFRSLIDLIAQINNANIESTARLFKPKLQAISNQFFTEAVEIILAKIFLLIDNEQMLDDATKLCFAFYRQDYGSGKNFTLELQKACLKYLSTKSHPSVEDIRSRLVKNQGGAIVSLPQEIGELEKLLKRKDINCVKLVAKLFERKHLSFTFLLSLADSLLARKTEDALECLFELFSRIGLEFEGLVLAKAMIEWWCNFWEEINELSKSQAVSQKMRDLANSLFQIKKNDWKVEDSKFAAVKLELVTLLNQLTTETFIKSPKDYASVENRIRSFVATETSKTVTPVIMTDAFLEKIHFCIEELARLGVVAKTSLNQHLSQNVTNGHPIVSLPSLEKVPSPPIAVKLPVAAPKLRKPSRWDQVDPMKVTVPNNNKPASPTELTQLMKTFDIKEEIMHHEVPTLTKPSWSATNTQVLANNNNRTVPNSGKPINFNSLGLPPKLQQQQQFFQHMAPGTWQHKPQALSGKSTYDPSRPPLRVHFSNTDKVITTGSNSNNGGKKSSILAQVQVKVDTLTNQRRVEEVKVNKKSNENSNEGELLEVKEGFQKQNSSSGSSTVSIDSPVADVSLVLSDLAGIQNSFNNNTNNNNNAENMQPSAA